jgi:protease-4
MIWKRKRRLDAAPGETSSWERELVEKVVTASLREGRRARRWGIFFKLLTFAYLIVLLVLLMPEQWSDMAKGSDEHTALVEINGVIAPGAKASADNVVTGLRDAYEDDNTKGIIVRINSPGGSPVQAGYINGEIQRLREKYPDIPVYAVVVDVCASGGYYIAVAADEIYADKASIVGSIGVRMDGFGFVDAMDELGVERRLLTAGENKAILDPFSPLRERDKEHVQGLLDEIHQQFIEVVREGRGERLSGLDEQIFSGLFWTGEQGLELGLVDGFGSSGYVARELIGAEDIVDFTREEDLLERLSKRLGAGIGTALGRFFGLEGDGPLLR